MTAAQMLAYQPPVQTQLLRLEDDDPNGVVKAPYGYVLVDNIGRAWVKRSGPTVNTGWELQISVSWCTTLADLQALTSYAADSVAFVMGRSAAFDNGAGQGIYIYDPDDTTADNSASTALNVRPTAITSDSDPGRWRMWKQPKTA